MAQLTKSEEIDHDKNLRAFLDRAGERNLRLNAEKTKLKMTEVPYIGHLLTREELRVDSKKAKAVQRWLGSVNCKVRPTPVRYTRTPQMAYKQGH